MSSKPRRLVVPIKTFRKVLVSSFLNENPFQKAIELYGQTFRFNENKTRIIHHS